MNLVMVAVLSALALGETVTLAKGLGTLLVLGGVGALKGGVRSMSLGWVFQDRAARYMLVCAAATASVKVIDRAGVQFTRPIFYAAAQTLTIALFYLGYLILAGRGADLGRAARRGLGLTVGTGLLNTGSHLAYMNVVKTVEVRPGCPGLPRSWPGRSLYSSDRVSRGGGAWPPAKNMFH